MSDKKIHLENKAFSGIESVKLDSVLHNPLLVLEKNGANKQAEGLKNHVKLCMYLLSDSIRVLKVGSPRIAFVFSNSYGNRKDHLNNYKSVISLIDDYLLFEPGRKRPTVKHIDAIKYTLLWKKRLAKLHLGNKVQQSFLLSNLTEAYIDASYIIRICQENGIEHINVFSDSHPIDNMVVQLAKEHNISTSTMQHGLFFEEGYVNSESDIFLAWGEQSMIRAVETGLSEESLAVVGMPQLVDRPINKTLLNNHTNRIVMICSSAEHDPQLLEILKQYAIKNKKKLWIKLHPGTSLNIEVKDPIEKVINDEYSIYDLINYVDFAVTAKSTVFVEYLLQLFPVFLYRTDDGRFNNMDWFKFGNIEEFEMLIKKAYGDLSCLEQQMIQSREYYTLTNNIAENYKAFFRNVDIDFKE